MERLLAEHERSKDACRSVSILSIGRDDGLRTSASGNELDLLLTNSLATPSTRAVEDVSHLTLAPCKEIILQALRDNPAVVISAPTSSGKTTWLPRQVESVRSSLFAPGSLPLDNEGYTICSVPRVIQTIKIAQYVSQLTGSELGEAIGYCNSQTGRYTPGVTSLMYQTHGYTAQQLLHRSIPDGSVIMIDEAHENPADLPQILLHVRELIEQKKPIKVVVMSATIKAKMFSDYFGGVPIIDPTTYTDNSAERPSDLSFEQSIIQKANRGRHKQIIAIPALEREEDDVIAAVDRGECPIVFVAGRKEIENLIDRVSHIDPSINCKPFYSKLPLREQQAIFDPVHGARTAIIATNVGGTGLTYPPHVNTVIITDEVKRMLNMDGGDLLAYDRITETEVLQLLGRTGRLKENGRAVLRLSRSKFDRPRPLEEVIPPEIQNISLATMLLRHKAAGRDLHRDNQKFIFKASRQQLEDAESMLHKLDLAGPQGHITQLGRISARFPVDAHIGKMLAKSFELRSTQPAVLRAAIDVAAVVDAEGIVTKEQRMWQDLRSTNTNSDLIAQMEVLQNALSIPAEDLASHGISEAQFFRARDTRQALRHRLGIGVMEGEGENLTPADLRSLRECIWSAFIPWLYRRVEERDEFASGEQLYKAVDGSGVRMLSKGTVVHNAQFIVGIPLSLEVRQLSERMDTLLSRISARPKTLPLIMAATAVDKDWLSRNIPPQFREAREAIRGDGRGKNDGGRHTRNNQHFYRR